MATSQFRNIQFKRAATVLIKRTFRANFGGKDKIPAGIKLAGFLLTVGNDADNNGSTGPAFRRTEEKPGEFGQFLGWGSSHVAASIQWSR
ncbi:hypothetical protein A9P96_18770 [Klebsiella pneumoniae]|nr:hypothetical protein N035_015095 [Klebsiella pneumoniae EGD-HP19-C]OCW01587.1 hypothetical protein A9P96_18770 [Klebsiella pneumoniae]